jgi:hypothetical protein
MYVSKPRRPYFQMTDIQKETETGGLLKVVRWPIIEAGVGGMLSAVYSRWVLR